MSEKITTILVTGPPGVGKTTLIKNICNELQSKQIIPCEGFFTEEVRQADTGTRLGFDIVTLNGKRDILARETPGDSMKRPKIGKYFVYTINVEKLALPLLLKGSLSKLLVVDEVGKMELLSRGFANAIENLMDKSLLIASVPYKSRHPIPIIERLKASKKSTIFTVSIQNRNQLQHEIVQKILKITK